MKASGTRRRFLGRVGKGTLLATVGPSLAVELGLVESTWAEGSDVELNFGDQEKLVRFMQDTSVENLQAGLMKKLHEGVPLQGLVAAGALANARTFAGEDYVGFHTIMALGPALKMAGAMPNKLQALPVFKVLFRNTNRIQEKGGRSAEALHRVEEKGSEKAASAQDLLKMVKSQKVGGTEKMFDSMVRRDVGAAFDALLHSVQEDTEVHRTVLPYRAWELIDVVGKEYASVLLRQSLRYCLRAEKRRRPEWEEHGKVLTALLDEHKLLGREPGNKRAEDEFIQVLSEAIFAGTPREAASAAASALGEGFTPSEVGEAISLAANQLVLRDHGRIPEWEIPGKVVGSVHGDSIGVHASDSANAWRNLASVSHGRNVYACLILGAWQVARDRTDRGGDFLNWKPVPSGRFIREVSESRAEPMLGLLREAIQANLQSRAAGIVHQYGKMGHPPKALISVLLDYAVSQDGALHAEKYFQTAWDDFHATRPAFRWRHLIALARVTASEYGYPAAGQSEARRLIGA